MRPVLFIVGCLWAAVVTAAEPPATRGSDTAFARAESLRAGGYLIAAASDYASVVRAGKQDGHREEALRALMALREQLQDDAYVETLLGDADITGVTLTPRLGEQLRYLRGASAEREGKLAEALTLLEAVTPVAPVYAKARYLMGVIRADARLTGGARPDQALKHFEEVLALRGADQEELERIQGLARLGIGRVRYAQGEYALASQAYEGVPRFSRFWGEALLENAFARFRRGDLGGALGSLETLHAPQFEGAFQPESWILKASVFYFSCLEGEAHAAIQAFEHQYGPVAKALERWVGEKRPARDYLAIVDEKAEGASADLPRGLKRWVRQHEPIAAALRLRTRLAEETQKGGLSETGEVLDGLTARLIRSRLEDASRELKRLGDQADVVRVETAKADKELVQAGVDQPALLAQQRLYRPGMPSDGWEYWRFDGEYWLDELGYYQYTMKNGCPPRAEEKALRRK